MVKGVNTDHKYDHIFTVDILPSDNKPVINP